MRTSALILVAALMSVMGCSDPGNQLTPSPQQGSNGNPSPAGQNEPAVEVIMDCLDRVSIGGTVQAVVNSQSEYDQLIYDRFTRPLQEYWNANYDSTLAQIRRRYPGLSDEEYARLVRQAFYSSFPFRGTDSCSTPAIDFTNFTLLGIDALAGGCTRPDYEMTVVRNDSTQTVTYKVRITQHGRCEIGWNRNKWILARKIPGNYTVQCEREYIRN